VLMVWWPFATKPERADTSEVTDLHSGAPPLYSTLFVVSKCFVKWCNHKERPPEICVGYQNFQG
jgi:hypothetical protein